MKLKADAETIAAGVLTGGLLLFVAGLLLPFATGQAEWFLLCAPIVILALAG